MVKCEKNAFTNAVTTGRSYVLLFCFRAVTTFLQLNLIVIKIYKKLVAALTLLPGSTNRRVGYSGIELSGDRATSVYGRRWSMFLFLNCSLRYFERPWLTVNDHERLKMVDRSELSC